ncbi:Clusterin-associated protein-1-domain-containing protein [Pelagophyceae sp. CCMP2097]|nr:Clusterin-associated protein-1-domain-containing protein [Pelagophyceae sp. CCMP2097]|eukprot:CAMPEP_0184099228 /NCGR_PEP_ID=MMETSP0974-20121125/11715_1 /TAXON_ID=483370 /ORGANISM="non described non described, Strain CCMP2097" /LENGTH=430 /DNA_ID=CAMNT_0026402131 /DNA_START=150 /DNA_END=1442 /DNA_ORIENTATION=-
MSFRELRNLTELLRALGFPRLVSVENFRQPNFELVASVLYWMVKRYDPEIAVSDIIESENDRVEFLTTVAGVMLAKAKVKLNAKRLYAADGRAVKELLKVATLLFSATRAEAAAKEAADGGAVQSLTSRMKDIKTARALATEITQKGARLHDLLGKERDVKPERDRALAFLDTISSNLDATAEHQHIQKSIFELVAQITDDISSTKRQVDELSADERALDAKISKKQSDLERHEKRLKSLQTVRPAFMDEYEAVERELQRHHDVYLERFRNLDYLQHELESYHATEKESLEEHDRSLRRLQKKLREEELRIMRGEQDLKEAKDGGDGAFSGRRDEPRAGKQAAGKSKSAAKAGKAPGGRVQGSMTGDDGTDSEDIDSDDVSHDSESESVSLAPSSNGASDVDEIEDDGEGSEMSEGEGSQYQSGQSSNEF